jgi:hypothetical protein
MMMMMMNFKHKPAHAVPVVSARPDQNPREIASQSGPEGPWPTGARWRALVRGRPKPRRSPLPSLGNLLVHKRVS